MIINLFAVFIGGAIGSICRYLTGCFCTKFFSTNLPIATFSVNFFGCLIIGLAYAYFMQKTNLNPAWKLAVTVGFCGGLSTLSALSYEIFDMLKNGQYIYSFIYTFLSIFVCVCAVFLGLKIGKFI